MKGRECVVFYFNAFCSDENWNWYRAYLNVCFVGVESADKRKEVVTEIEAFLKEMKQKNSLVRSPYLGFCELQRLLIEKGNFACCLSFL